MAKTIIADKTITGPQLGFEDDRYNLRGFGFYQQTGELLEYDEPLKFGVARDGYYWWNWYHRVYRMKLDPTVSLLRQMFIAPIISAGWTVDADDDVPDEIVDYTRDEMDRIHADLIRQAGLGCADYGWAPFEIIPQYRTDGLLGIKQPKSLLQCLTEIEVDEKTGAYTGLSQENVFLPPEKSLLFNFGVEGTDWYGTSILRAAESAFNSQRRINKSRAKLNARIAASHWVIYYPVGTTEQEGEILDNFTIASRVMEQMLTEGSTVLPNEIRSELNILNGDAATSDYQAWRIELLGGGDSTGGATFYTDQLRYEDALKARAFGFPERALLEGQFGTKAEAEAHADAAILGLELRASELTDTVSKQLLQNLIVWNWGEEYRDKVALRANPLVDETLRTFWKIYDKFTEDPDVLLNEYDEADLNMLRERIGIPMLEEGSEGNLEDKDIDTDDDTEEDESNDNTDTEPEDEENEDTTDS